MENSSPTIKSNRQIIDQNSKHPKIILPNEVLTDIISRLPVKSVYQLQCLSKNFSSITNDRNFINNHLKHSGRLRPSLIASFGFDIYVIQRGILKTIEVPLSRSRILYDLGIFKRTSELVGSCNGLVVVRINNRGFILLNPITLKFDNLPIPSEISSRNLREIRWGFGYCAESKVYKIVMLPPCSASCRKFSNLVAQVLTYGTDCAWRKVDLNGFDIPYDDNGITVKGVVYWKPFSYTCDKLLSFDLEKEEFAWIFCPGTTTEQMMEFKGSLAICVKSEIKKNTYELWVLKDKDSDDVYSWEKIYTANTYHQLIPYYQRDDYLKVYLSLYDLKRAEIDDIFRVPNRCIFRTLNFTESVVPLSAHYKKEHMKLPIPLMNVGAEIQDLF